LIFSRARASFRFVSFEFRNDPRPVGGAANQGRERSGRTHEDRQAAGSTSQILAIWRAVLLKGEARAKSQREKKTSRWATIFLIENSHDLLYCRLGLHVVGKRKNVLDGWYFSGPREERNRAFPSLCRAPTYNFENSPGCRDRPCRWLPLPSTTTTIVRASRHCGSGGVRSRFSPAVLSR